MWQPGGGSSACPGCRTGQRVPRQGWGRISTRPGQLAQKGPKIAHTKTLQAPWCFIPWWSLRRDRSYVNPSGICLSQTASPQAGGLGTVPGLSWRQLCFLLAVFRTAQGYQCCSWVFQSLPGLSRVPRGTGLGVLCWGHLMAALHLSLDQYVMCTQFSTAKFPHLGLQSPE